MSRLGKSLKLVITFDNPTHAFAFESACKKGNIAGRLLPVPVELTGGCGIGWTSKIAVSYTHLTLPTILRV